MPVPKLLKILLVTKKICLQKILTDVIRMYESGYGGVRDICLIIYVYKSEHMFNNFQYVFNI